MAAIEEEEDDYMSMTITEPNKPKERETYTQRRIRKEREVISDFLPPYVSLTGHRLSKRVAQSRGRSSMQKLLLLVMQL